MPLHVAIILDGNRRNAKARRLSPWQGHLAGLHNLRKIMKEAHKFDINELTLYVLSIQNFQRSKIEVEKLLGLLKKTSQDLLNDKTLERDQVRIKFIGFKELFPEDNRKLMVELEEKTKEHLKFTINLCAGYGGREEILDAVKKIVSKKIPASEINEKTISDNLWLSSEPDIVIRPGGEIRTSNYLPWQSIYSEWFFIKKMWPEFTSNDLKKITKEFLKRKRRF